MTEQNIPDEELNVVGEEDTPFDENGRTGPAEVLDPVGGEPDSYPGAAEENPDRWQEDPLLQGEVSGEEEDFLSDQTLRDETAEARFEAGDEQTPPYEPTIGEAASDVDFGDPMAAEEVDASDDQANFGGSPLSQFEPEDLER